MTRERGMRICRVVHVVSAVVLLVIVTPVAVAFGDWLIVFSAVLGGLSSLALLPVLRRGGRP